MWGMDMRTWRGGGRKGRVRRIGRLGLTCIHSVQFSSVAQLRPHGPQYVRPPCPSPTPGVYPNSCPLSQWCPPTISSSVVPFSSCPRSFPASGSFQMSQFFASGGQSAHTLGRVKQIASGNLLQAGGAQLGALWWPRWGEWGGETKERGIHVSLQLIHSVVQQKLTQHCKAITLQFKSCGGGHLKAFQTRNPANLTRVRRRTENTIRTWKQPCVITWHFLCFLFRRKETERWGLRHSIWVKWKTTCLFGVCLF